VTQRPHATCKIELLPDGYFLFGPTAATGNVGEEKFDIVITPDGIVAAGKHAFYGITWKEIMRGVARVMDAELTELGGRANA
jgi:hypothetical protein